jgi:hypothetical protein
VGITEQALELGWHDAWLHEQRGYHGRWEASGQRDQAIPESRATWATWGAQGDALLKQSVGHKAHMLRTHDVIVYGDAQLRPGGFGMVTVLMPAEIIKLRHHWERHGKRRRRYSDLTVRLPDGREVEQSMPDNSDIKLLPRPKRHRRAPAHHAPPKPKPEPKPKVEPEPGSIAWFREHPGEVPPATTPIGQMRPFGLPPMKPPPPEPPPKTVTGEPNWKALKPGASDPLGMVVTPDDIVNGDKAGQQAAIAMVQHGLDHQKQFVPKLADRQVIIFKNFPDITTDGETKTTTPGEPIEVSPSVISGGADAENARLMREGWWVPCDPQWSEADCVVAHEFGHVLASHQNMTAMDNFWYQLAQTLNIEGPSTWHDPITGEDHPDMDEWLASYKDTIKDQVSEYATTNRFELQAELWREYTMSRHPRPPAKLYGDWMMDHLGRYA